MAAELISCPHCQKKLRVPENLLGQPVKCPTCSQVFTADPKAASGEPPPEPARPTAVSRRREEDDEDAPRPRRSRVAAEEDEEDDRPRRRRPRYEEDEDDEDDDRAYRRRRRRDYVPHRGPLILTFGILSLVILPIVFGPIAWIMGNNDLAEIRAGRMDPEGEGLTSAGRVCGMIGTLLFGGGMLLCCLFYGVIFMAAAAGGMR
jgi:predicted Zn finger-like uncharacterized protein